MRMTLGPLIQARTLGSVVAALVLEIAAPAMGDDVRRGEDAITCTNPVSGATWQIKINYDRSTVDSNPARFNESRIWWHDAADGGNYTLDRKTGNLTVILASSTGGSFLYDRCKLEN